MNEWMNESVLAIRTNGMLGQNSLFAGGNRSLGTFQKDSKRWLTCCGLLKGTVWGQGDGRTAFSFDVSLSINPQDSDSVTWEQYQGPWSKGPGKRWAGPPSLCPPLTQWALQAEGAVGEGVPEETSSYWSWPCGSLDITHWAACLPSLNLLPRLENRLLSPTSRSLWSLQ